MPRIKVTGRELAAGAFVLVAVVGALYLAYRATPWARGQDLRFHALLDRAYGLRDGSPVRMRDVTVGRVTAARLLAGGGARGKVRVDFFVRATLDGERLGDLFSESGAVAATLSLERSLLLGGQSALAIEPGGVGPPGADGSHEIVAVIAPEEFQTLVTDTLHAVRTAAVSIATLADDISGRGADGPSPAQRLAALGAGLEELIGTPAHDGVPRRRGSVAAALDSLDDLMKAIRDPSEGTVGRLVSSTELHDELVERLDHADEVLAATQRALDVLVVDSHRLIVVTTEMVEHANRSGVASVVTGDDDSGAQLARAVEAARRAMANLDHASTRLPAVSDDLSRAIEDGRRVMGDAEDALAGARRHWLLSGLFTRRSDPWLRAYDLGDDAEGGD